MCRLCDQGRTARMVALDPSGIPLGQMNLAWVTERYLDGQERYDTAGGSYGYATYGFGAALREGRGTA